MDKNERLMEAFTYLKSLGKIHTQKDAAVHIGATPQNFSAALKGNPAALTDNFLRRFNSAFDEIFNIDWLLTGEGEMLKDSVTHISHGDNSTNIAGNGNTIRTNTGDTAVLQERVKLLEKLLDEKDKLLAEKERLLEEKERLIKVLMER